MRGPVNRGSGSWQLAVLAKAPLAGRVKTRLCPPLDPARAAELAAAALADTMTAGLASSAGRRLLVLDGDPAPWRGRGFVVVAQRGGGLGERLAHAFEDAAAGSELPTLLVGMDTPQLEPEDLDAVAQPLLVGKSDVVLGPALDGGFWTIGVRHPVPGLFDGVPMSTPGTGAAQLRRAAELGLTVALGPARRDVDEWADAVAVAEEAPATRFASAVRSELDRLVSGIRSPNRA